MIYSSKDWYHQIRRLAAIRRILRRRAKLKVRQRRSPPCVVRPNFIDYWSSPWGRLLVHLASVDGGPSIESRDGKLFRRRFRVPYSVFCSLVTKCIEKKIFGENSLKETDIANRSVCPIEIKLLAVLRILGRNWNFDDIAEATLMGETTARRSFHTFCENFVGEFYSTYVYRPTGEKLYKVMKVFELMGLPGCIGSTDCVHLKWDRCPVGLAQLCSGKEGYPTLAYSCTVDHHHRILASTSSYWGAKNDKTIVRGDTYITDVREKKVHADVEYSVYVNGVLKPVKGVYYICDGGYHKWTCMMNPMKHTAIRSDRLWSEWLESTRKDVECTFGGLKSRWRFLRNGIVLQDQHSIDNAFFTCCILHNMILEDDGLDCRWEKDVDWEAINPQPTNSDEGFDEGDGPVISNQEMLINRRVSDYITPRDITVEEEIALGNDFEEEWDNGFDAKRKLLIDHFIYAYNLGLVKWPSKFPEEKKQIYDKGK